jgi:2-C-methyl-D-erythritol 2,4-cyclodiphosphate synthase
MRIGHGFDVHRFTEGDFVTLGGVKVPHSKGIEAHSDGDVILHAICDAMLGAAGLGDIGQFYPPSDDRFKNMDSRKFLRDVKRKVREMAYQVANLDVTVIAQVPKLGPYREQMREIIAEDLQLEKAAVNIKATTTEKLGYLGREEGIAAHAVVLLKGVV